MKNNHLWFLLLLLVAGYSAQGQNTKLISVEATLLEANTLSVHCGTVTYATTLSFKILKSANKDFKKDSVICLHVICPGDLALDKGDYKVFFYSSLDKVKGMSIIANGKSECDERVSGVVEHMSGL